MLRVNTNKTVLIVDDNDLVLDSIDLLLSAADGFRSLRAHGSAGALSHLQHTEIDVIVADVILTGNLSGLDICRIAIEHHPAVAVVVITADTEVDDSEIPPRGVFLRKPFDSEHLLEAIALALKKSGATSASP